MNILYRIKHIIQYHSILIFLLLSSIIVTGMIHYNNYILFTTSVMPIYLSEEELQQRIITNYAQLYTVQDAKIDQIILNTYSKRDDVSFLSIYGTMSTRNYEIYTSNSLVATELANFIHGVYEEWGIAKNINVLVLTYGNSELVDYCISRSYLY